MKKIEVELRKSNIGKHNTVKAETSGENKSKSDEDIVKNN